MGLTCLATLIHSRIKNVVVSQAELFEAKSWLLDKKPLRLHFDHKNKSINSKVQASKRSEPQMKLPSPKDTVGLICHHVCCMRTAAEL